ncbi:uncharacterized protein KGF55_000788 [Candida pseudojiufengensis]|uniref:uncharacterized protein n=1 Tax=Candida pseudojiufengensis TaxID=497109 RepID=UPI0022241DA7|nr:uncharacterized protein KGF55_000788 [Candida pseudojiufengensis]KAI5966479.1 hypothetical protein KGF55_000788 [Candida pseudojiufengensis]
MTTNRFGNIQFTKSSSDEVKQDETLNKSNGSMSMMASIHDEYSDFEDEEEEDEDLSSAANQRNPELGSNEDSKDDEVFEEEQSMSMVSQKSASKKTPIIKDSNSARQIHFTKENTPHHDTSTMNDLNSSNNNEQDVTIKVSSKYHKYGIGAKLMMKMGYQEGKGLGNDQSGIVDPINATSNMGKFGLGARSNKIIASADDEDEQYKTVEDDEKALFLKKVLKLSYKIYNLVGNFEQNNIILPEELITWANNVKTIETDQEYDRAKEVYNYFDEIWDDFHAYNEKQKKLNKELNILDDTNPGKRCLDLTTLKIDLEDMYTSHEEIYHFEYVPKLSDLSLTDDEKASVFLTLSQQDLAYILQVPLEDYSKNEIDIIPSLNKYAEICTKLTPNSNLFFNYLIQQYIIKFNELFEGSGYDDAETDELNIEILSTWVSLSSSILKEKLLSKCFQAVFVGYVFKRIKEWNPLDIDRSDWFIDDYLILLSATNVNMDQIFSILITKIRDYFELENRSSIWTNFGTASDLKKIKLQVSEIFQMRLPTIRRYDQVQAQSLVKLFERSFPRWLENALTSFHDKRLVYEWSFCLAEVSKFESCFSPLQYILFNRWIMELVELGKNDSKRAIEFYANWFQYFQEKLIHCNSSVITDLINWYLNKALKIIKSNFDDAECSNLPRSLGSIRPTADDLLKFDDSTSLNANGIPSHNLMTTFKDILLEYCSSKNITMNLLKDSFHFTKGYPIYRFNFEKKSIFGYIEDDVLWINSDEDNFETQDYRPLLMDNLIDEFSN